MMRRLHKKPLLPMASAPNLVLPSGKVFDARLARERLVELTAHRGLTTQRQRTRLQRQQEAIDQLAQAVKLHNQGVSANQIGKMLGVTHTTVKKWFAGKVARDAFGPRTHRYVQSKRNKIPWKQILSNPASRGKLAYCFGALFGNLSITVSKKRLINSFQTALSSHAFAEKLADYIAEISGNMPSLERKAPNGKGELTYLRVTSVEMVQFVNRETMDQTRPPSPKVLRTLEDIRRFAQGYWDSRGHVSSNGQLYVRVQEPVIRSLLQSALITEKIKFHEGAFKRIHIQRESFPIFATRIGFTEPQKQDQLDRLIRR